VVSHKELKPVSSDNLKPVPKPVVKSIVPKMTLQPQVKKEPLHIIEKKISTPKTNKLQKVSHIELKSLKPTDPGTHELIGSQN
jgi:hypothetical protein